MADDDYPPVSPLGAGLRCRCPRCGRGRLFEGLLTVAPKCTECGLDFSPHDSGDGPAVFVIFLLGAIVVALAFLLESLVRPPLWVHAALWLPVIVGLTIVMLRPMKATLVAYHYKNLKHEYRAGD